MLVVVSPAKNLDYTSTLPDYLASNASCPISSPELIEKTKELVERCKDLSPADLSSLMKISDKLAHLNTERFNSFEFPFSEKNARPAMFAFNGDVYTGLAAQTLSEKDTKYAQGHLRILSGLYGVLKPLDLMQPYRLEMGTKLRVNQSENLYQYWDNTITENLNNAISEVKSDILVNLASNEYFHSVNQKAINATLVTPVFKDQKNGTYKIISFFAKKARGLMARYIIQNQIDKIDDLVNFNVDGYKYCSNESTPSKPVFMRSESDRPA